MNEQLYFKNIAVNLTSQESRASRFLDFLYAGLSVLKFSLKLSPALAICAFLWLLAGCGSSDITRAGEKDAGNGQAQHQLLLADFEPSNPNDPCVLDSEKWSSWGGLKLSVSPYGDDPPDKVSNPSGGKCYLKVVPNSDPSKPYPGTAMIYVGKGVSSNGYLTFDLRLDQFSGDSPLYGQILLELVDDDNVPYTINIDPTEDLQNKGDDLFAYIYPYGYKTTNQWVRVSIPLTNLKNPKLAFLDTNPSLGDNILNTESSSTSSNSNGADAGTSDTVTGTSSQNNGGLLAVRITPRDRNMVLSIDNIKITDADDTAELTTSNTQPDAGTDADAGMEQDGGVITPDADLDAGTQTDGEQDGGVSTDSGNDGGVVIPDAENDGGPIADGGTDSGTDTGTDAGSVTNPPYTIDDSEGSYTWYTWGGATGSFELSGSAPVPPLGLNLGSYVLKVNGTVNNGASYPGGIGRYNGKSASGSDYLTFSVGGQGALRIIVADHDFGTGIDYFQSNAIFSSDTGQFATYGWRTYSVPFSAFTLDTQQNTYTGDPLGDGTFNPTISASSDGLQKVHFTLQANSDAPSNSQVHLYFDNVRTTTDDQGDGIADIVIPDSSPFPVDNFDDGNYNSNPAWFSGDGIIIDITQYALAGIVPPPNTGTHFVTLHGSTIPAALYGGYFGTYLGKKVSPLNDIVKLAGWDLVGRLVIKLEFEMDDSTTRQFRYVFEDTTIDGDEPNEVGIAVTAFTDDTGHSITFYPTTDPNGKYKLKNLVLTLEKSTGDVDDTMVSLDHIRIEP